ncbi:cupin domain-containing protein [Streptomyces europaeiscabiei]|uniref:cupin domain-containing protein n=1 Tax=Streptomyces europaeiscabiei TaxID=146819 RepID=UPI003867AC92
MAIIVLNPGEVFEHSHTKESTTVLLCGALELDREGTITQLSVGDAIVTNAGIPERFRNSGDAVAAFNCVH